MKRFATAAAAAVTAISLSTAAVAQSPDDDGAAVSDVSPGHETAADIADLLIVALLAIGGAAVSGAIPGVHLPNF